ncbi:hypothetical protein IscW_ISCW008795 [Ixodes scapularis]|uniref:Spaetzle domain-containing protein n=1 Tax=Ixodes scapularis TaxID=6945 RepID=B7Q2J4_IXOSC|nr:hypothetical protein IscW_ISCW008795 [Ixodes scapularis]|eukprot:XP_002410846.1 hypothetical protein IscW_ISCW008795 [Ixodes scapularis]
MDGGDCGRKATGMRPATWVENYTLAFAQEKQHGSFVCRSEAVYLRIGWAKNWKGLWLTVVNTERFPQVTRVEKCKSVQWVENYTLAFAQEKQHGSFVCRSEAVYLRIGWAKNWKGLWLTVVNTERFPQVTRVEKCKYRGKPCDYMVPCYKSSCKQREMLFPLIAVNPYDPGQKPSIELFPIPSGCVCYVDDFRFH